MLFRIVVLLSGQGSNFVALLDGMELNGIRAEVVAVGSDKDCPGLEAAVSRRIPIFKISPTEYSSREKWGKRLAFEIASNDPDLIILSGFMKVLPPTVVRKFSPRIINTHPSWLPNFPGAHAVRDALAAGVSETGASVIVVDEGVDTGPIVDQSKIQILPEDTLITLHERIKIAERRMLLRCVENMVANRESDRNEKK